jgi:hypothetical protein
MAEQRKGGKDSIAERKSGKLQQPNNQGMRDTFFAHYSVPSKHVPIYSLRRNMRTIRSYPTPNITHHHLSKDHPTLPIHYITVQGITQHSHQPPSPSGHAIQPCLCAPFGFVLFTIELFDAALLCILMVLAVSYLLVLVMRY